MADFFSWFTSMGALKDRGGGKVTEKATEYLEMSLPRKVEKSGKKKLNYGIYKQPSLAAFMLRRLEGTEQVTRYL